MTKLIELFNTLMKYKLIKRPKCFLILILVLGVLGVPKYINMTVENGLKKVLIEKLNHSNKLIKYRAEISSDIDACLKDLGHKINADRVFLGEFSNTVTGTSGLHFFYYTINNEYDKPGIIPIAKQHQKQNCSNLKIVSSVVKNKILAIKNIEDIKDSDPITYYTVKANGTKQLFLMYFELPDETPIGFIGASYEKNSFYSETDIFYEMSVSLRNLQRLFKYDKKEK